jgi:hypothetical protein
MLTLMRLVVAGALLAPASFVVGSTAADAQFIKCHNKGCFDTPKQPSLCGRNAERCRHAGEPGWKKKYPLIRDQQR